MPKPKLTVTCMQCGATMREHKNLALVTRFNAGYTLGRVDTIHVLWRCDTADCGTEVVVEESMTTTIGTLIRVLENSTGPLTGTLTLHISGYRDIRETLTKAEAYELAAELYKLSDQPEPCPYAEQSKKAKPAVHVLRGGNQ